MTESLLLRGWTGGRDGWGRTRVCILGCGAITERLYLPALARYPSILRRLVLVDPDVERAERLARAYGVSNVAPSHERAFRDAEAVVVAVPHPSRFELSEAAIRAGCHVLCEQPLAGSPEEARALVRLADRKDVVLAVNSTRRFHPAAARTAQLVRSGRIGDVKRIVVVERVECRSHTASRFGPGGEADARGILLDVGTGVIDLLCWWMEERPRVVFYQDDSQGGPEADAHLHLAFADGARAEVRLSYLGRAANRYRIEGERGVLEGDSTDWQRLRVIEPDGRREAIRATPEFGSVEEIGFSVVDDFLRATSGTSTVAVPGSAAIPSIEVVGDAYQRRHRFAVPWMPFEEIRRDARASA